MPQNDLNSTKIFIAKFLIIGFFSMLALMFIFPYILGLPPDEYAENIKMFISAMTFVLGFVLGWLFKGDDKN